MFSLRIGLINMVIAINYAENKFDIIKDNVKGCITKLSNNMPNKRP